MLVCTNKPIGGQYVTLSFTVSRTRPCPHATKNKTKKTINIWIQREEVRNIHRKLRSNWTKFVDFEFLSNKTSSI